MQPKTTPKDFFLNLGVIVTLYFSVISFINLLFSIINEYFPDPLSYGSFYSGGMRMAISALVILFPLYLYLSHLVNKDLSVFPEKKELWIKKWSTYLTLFLTGATIAVDLIFLINTFLGGEITTRFILKSLTVLIVAMVVFSYYLYELKKQTGNADSRPKIFAFVVSVIVLITLIGGLASAGSPFNERLKRFDDRRTQDLHSIQSQITYYWQRKGALPETLNDLNDPLSSYIVPKDPQTNEQYEYRRISENSFELCAEFSTSSRSDANDRGMRNSYPVDYYGDQSFTHDAGRTCFERSIDPSLYPPLQR
jgi:hypothetical protein